MSQIDEWEEKLGKDERYFVLSYTNDSKYSFRFSENQSSVDAKYSYPPSKKLNLKSLIIEPGQTIKMGLRVNSTGRCVLKHAWFNADEKSEKIKFIFNLQYGIREGGKTSGILTPENLFQIRSSLRKSKPPLVKVVLGYDPTKKSSKGKEGELPHTPITTPTNEEKRKSANLSQNKPIDYSKELEDINNQVNQTLSITKTLTLDNLNNLNDKERTKIILTFKQVEEELMQSLLKCDAISNTNMPDIFLKTKKELINNIQNYINQCESLRKQVENGSTIGSVTPEQIETFKQKVGVSVNTALSLVDQGQFMQSHAEFMNAIASMVSFDKNSYSILSEYILFSVVYAQASKFLLELQRLQFEKLYKQMALVSKFLIDIPVQPNHQLTNYHIAIRLNFQIGNFETAAKIIAALENKFGEQPEELYSGMLKTAEEHQFQNKSIPMNSTDSSKFCFQTMRLIHESNYSKCSFCSATYRVHLLQNCVYCNSTVVLV